MLFGFAFMLVASSYPFVLLDDVLDELVIAFQEDDVVRYSISFTFTFADHIDVGSEVQFFQSFAHLFIVLGTDYHFIDVPSYELVDEAVD